MHKDIGQLFFIGIEGKTLTDHEYEFIVKNNIGGVTLFSRNLDSPAQIHKLCSDLHHLQSNMPSRVPPIIAIDMEGGRVHRLKAPFTQWPSMQKLARLNSTSVAFKFAQFMAKELLAVGINMDFAPCVDVLTNSKNQLISDRSFGENSEDVSRLGSAVVRGLIKSNVLACAKHFPGHGNTIIDSHEDLPIEEVSLQTLMERELVPFKTVFRSRIDFVMTAHILYKNVDPARPATLSEKILKDLLRTEVKFRGLVISDDLDMKALTNNYAREDIPVMAFTAGCDILLYCNDKTSPPIAIEAVSKAIAEKRLDENHLLERAKALIDLKKENLPAWRTLDFKTATSIIAHPDHLRLAKAIEEGVVAEDLIRT